MTLPLRECMLSTWGWWAAAYGRWLFVWAFCVVRLGGSVVRSVKPRWRCYPEHGCTCLMRMFKWWRCGGMAAVAVTATHSGDRLAVHVCPLSSSCTRTSPEHPLVFLPTHCHAPIRLLPRASPLHPAPDSTWHYPKHTDGLAPQARSSHRAAALPDRIVVHGGAAGENDPNRLADVATLHVASLSRLQWSNCDQPSASARQPQGGCTFLRAGLGVQRRRARHGLAACVYTFRDTGFTVGHVAHFQGATQHVHQAEKATHTAGGTAIVPLHLKRERWITGLLLCNRTPSTHLLHRRPSSAQRQPGRQNPVPALRLRRTAPGLRQVHR